MKKAESFGNLSRNHSPDVKYNRNTFNELYVFFQHKHCPILILIALFVISFIMLICFSSASDMFKKKIFLSPKTKS